MKSQMMHVTTGPGRVLIGPKKLRGCYARIVSAKDGSGRIETYHHRSGTWIPAHESITFTEVWSAPSAPALMSVHTRAEIAGSSPAVEES